MIKRILTLVMVLAGVAVFAQSRSGLLNRRNMRRNNPAANNAQPTADQSAANQRAREAAEAGGRSIEFDQVPVDLVYQVYGNLVNKTIIADPNAPKATITLKPQKGQELTDEDKIHAIETVLEMNQIHLEPYGDKFIRAIPRKEVRKEGIPLIMDPDADFGESTKVVSFMIGLKNISAEDAQKILDQFKSASGLLIAIERNNTILLTDTEANINRMREIIKVIDVASPVNEVVEYIQIKNASANDIKEVLDAIVQESQKEQEGNKAPKNSTLNQSNSAFQPRRLLGGKQPEAPKANESLLMSISDADRGMIRGKVVTIADERSNKILIITNASNMKFFKDVIAALDVETTPDTVVKVYRLKYAEAEDVSDMINDLIGNSSASKSSGKSNQNLNSKNGTSGNTTRGTQSAAKKPANQRNGDSKAGELSKDNTTVLSDKRINGLVVMTDKELVPTIEAIIESMDIKLSQVLIETCIIEVTLGDNLKTGMDWVKLGRKRQTTKLTDKLGNVKYKVYTKGSTDDDGNYTAGSYTGNNMTEAEFAAAYGDGTDANLTLSDVAATVTKTVSGGFWSNTDKGFQLGGGGGTGSSLLSTLSGAASTAASTATTTTDDDSSDSSVADTALTTLNPIGGGINYFFKSDKLNLGAVIQASQNDSHSKYVASPIVMTLDNKEANVEATSSRQFLTGWQAVSSSYAGSGLPSPTYTAKDIGIKLKITPKINPNGTVMLEVEEEYSQVSGTQTMLTPVGNTYQDTDIDVAVTRKMSSDVLLENGQTVVFGGLTERLTSNSESGIPFLKDIPYIGKWLFGTVSEEEKRVELLVFMTPYVLNDAQAAQVEALRRKKTMSDARPWDDNGWSASNLADPVSKKEQLRRLKDEWRKQDEERQTRMAIEQEKLNRVKRLQEMSEEERKLWLEMHKKELEKEQQEEMEKKMLDKDSQAELRKLADSIRQEKLRKAEAALKKNEEETRSENERGRMEAEKKAAKDTEVKPVEAKKAEVEVKPAEVKKEESKVIPNTKSTEEKAK